MTLVIYVKEVLVEDRRKLLIGAGALGVRTCIDQPTSLGTRFHRELRRRRRIPHSTVRDIRVVALAHINKGVHKQ